MPELEPKIKQKRGLSPLSLSNQNLALFLLFLHGKCKLVTLNQLKQVGVSTYMSLSAKQASEMVGLTRNGIIKAIKEGRISGEKNEKGEWQVEPVELLRVYKAVEGVEVKPIIASGSQSTHQLTEVDTQKIVFLEEKVTDLKNQLQKSEQREEKAQSHITEITVTMKNQSLLLTDQRQKAVENNLAERQRPSIRKGSDSRLWVSLFVLVVFTTAVVTYIFVKR